MDILPEMVRKIEFFFFLNIYDVDNEFYEKEEGAMYVPRIADYNHGTYK